MCIRRAHSDDVDYNCRHINEDKRKTECHQTMFDIINDIENCPVSDR